MGAWGERVGISVTTGRRVIIAQNLRKHYVFICAKKKVFSIFNTKKVKSRKAKNIAIFGKFIENSPTCNCVRTVVQF